MTLTGIHPPARPAVRPPRRRRAFTVIELLMVIGIIILLMSLVIVAVRRVVPAAQSANTKFLMTSIRTSLVQFKEDTGYYPPVLDPDRGLVSPPDPTGGAYATDIQSWWSVTSLADYLIGYGDEQQDAHQGVGIRSPGRDGVWGATVLGAADGSLGARNAGTGAAPTGPSLGPYLELKDDRLLGAIDGTINPDTGQFNVFFPGDPVYANSLPKTIVDYWGNPIRYYRQPYPRGALKQAYRPNVVARVPVLGDAYLLRPFFFKQDSDAVPGLADGNGDDLTAIGLQTAEFATFSSGPDRAFDPTVRRDDVDYNGDGIERSNVDNIVEYGP